MPEPGYYKTSMQAATLREMVRMRGLFKLPLTFILMKFILRPGGGAWMPSTCVETDCTAEQLSPRFWEAMASQRQTFERIAMSFSKYGG